MPLQKCCSNLLSSLTFLVLSTCKLLQNKNVIQFYGWILITIEHWNIVQLANYNKIFGLMVLTLITIPPSTNHHLIKGIKLFFRNRKLDYDISSWSLNMKLDLGFNTCNIFIFGFVVYENLQCFWILEAMTMAFILKNKI
jgi:hypothetical protein